MPSISDKLKSLGVKVGAQDLPPPRPRSPSNLEAVLAGRAHATRIGETYLVETRYPAHYRHGRWPLHQPAPLQAMATWAAEQRLCDCPPEAFVFLDTETTGLSGGSGTYTFLIGVGRFEGDDFRLAQFFMRDPLEEPAQLAALEEFLAPCQALVTYNGKAFDVPLLNARFITHGWRPPFLETAHVDLLHLARRLWRDRLPSRTLGNVEYHILGAQRTEQDVPGWMIPQMYFDYLRSGDARPLKGIFYHNAMDVVSLAALFSHTAGLLADPFNGNIDHGQDRIALAKLFEDLGDLHSAASLYLRGLEQDLPQATLLEAIHRLSMIYKRQGDFPPAVDLWTRAAGFGHLPAYVELAKYYEHRARDPHRALEWTLSALAAVRSAGLPAYERRGWLSELEHRKSRLERKLLGKIEPGSDGA